MTFNAMAAAAAVSKPSAPAPAKTQANPGIKQLDGNQSTLGAKPTRASLQDRPSTSPAGRPGLEQAMGTLADQLHPPKFRGRR